MTREEEAAAIAQFLEDRGATKCRTAYVGLTSTNFSAAEEARRLAQLKVKVLTQDDVRCAAHHFYKSLKP